MLESQLAVGRAAPALRVNDRRGHWIALADVAGEPLVVAFCDSWSEADAGDDAVASLRAELRGLGAALVIVSSKGVWRFRADDEWQLCAPAAALDTSAIADLRERFEMKLPGLGLFIVDGSGVLRFARTISCPPDRTTGTLVDALAKAGRATLASRRPHFVTVSRREIVVASLLAAFALVLTEACRTKEAPPTPAAPPDASLPPADPPHEVDVTLDVNGNPQSLRIDTRVSLLDALRERMGLPGTKKGCDHGQCGACTVLVDGRRVNACLTLAVMAQGTKIVTIEGLANGDVLHPVQSAFIGEDGFQCGYCTPGQIMSAVGLLREGHAHTDDEVREAMSGNICRCGAYVNIVSAVQLARKSGAA